MVRSARQLTDTLKAAGGLAATMLALALLLSCARRPLATPTAPMAMPTTTPLPAPTTPDPRAGGALPPRKLPSLAAR